VKVQREEGRKEEEEKEVLVNRGRVHKDLERLVPCGPRTDALRADISMVVMQKKMKTVNAFTRIL
jgi:hypothetical protein